MITRRQFVLAVLPAAGVAALAHRGASAQAVKLAEDDPAAKALGYHLDAAKVDPKKFPTYAAGHDCTNCALYQGKPGDEFGPCGAFGGKLVHSKGWCAAWSKKA